MQSSIPKLITESKSVLPIISLTSEQLALKSIDLLLRSTINAAEITLRSTESLRVLKCVRQQYPELFLCAGSITRPEEVQLVSELDINLIITPGIHPTLLEAAKDNQIDILPGISSASDILLGLEYGLRYFKLFPVEALGGIKFLEALSAPFPDCRFCPTGGINANNYLKYLQNSQVDLVAGSWLIPSNMTKHSHWHDIYNNIQVTINQLTELQQ